MAPNRLELDHSPWISDFSINCAGCSRERAGQEGPAPFALPAFEIAVAGADCILAWLQLVAVHGNAHAASGKTPFSASFLKHPVQSFCFGLAAYAL